MNKPIASAIQKAEPYDQPATLMLETIRLVRDYGVLQVYEETGVSFYWLRKFTAGQFRNPSVNRVQYLYEYLTKSTLVK